MNYDARDKQLLDITSDILSAIDAQIYEYKEWMKRGSADPSFWQKRIDKLQTTREYAISVWVQRNHENFSIDNIVDEVIKGEEERSAVRIMADAFMAMGETE